MQPTMKIGDEMVMDENESHLYRFLLDCQAAQRATLADAMAAHNEMAARVGRRFGETHDAFARKVGFESMNAMHAAGMALDIMVGPKGGLLRLVKMPDQQQLAQLVAAGQVPGAVPN